MSTKMHSTLVHGGKVRHVAGVFADKDTRKSAMDEFESVLEDAMIQKKKIAIQSQKIVAIKEKEELEKKQLEDAEKQRKLEEENMNGLEHLMEEEIEDRERAERQKAALKKVKLFFNRAAAAFTRAFVDYGPPYKEMNLMDGVNLIAQCSNYPVRLLDLHFMLNERINPNMRDPEDLHYSAMHWCARNFSVLGMKMLRRAGADINIHNELDQTPLCMCVITKQTDRREYQLKAIKYMLSEGAEVNTRDKAGYGPVDYAAMAQDEEAVAMLIEAGGVIVRVNETFVGPRENVLDHVTDTDTYRTILEQHERETAVRDAAAAEALAIRMAEAEKARIRKLHRDLARKRDHRLESIKQREHAQKEREQRDARMARMAADDAKEKARQAERLLQFGEWRKKEDTGHWGWEHRKTYESRTFGHVYKQAQTQMQQLRDDNCFDKFDGRWNAVTGKHLEVPWGRGTAFEVEGIDNNKKINQLTIRTLPVTDTASVLFKDENDKELEGEDLTEMMGSLVSSRASR